MPHRPEACPWQPQDALGPQRVLIPSCTVVEGHGGLLRDLTAIRPVSEHISNSLLLPLVLPSSRSMTTSPPCSAPSARKLPG